MKLRTDVRDFETAPAGLLSKALIATFGVGVPIALLVVVSVVVSSVIIAFGGREGASRSSEMEMVMHVTGIVMAVGLYVWRHRTLDVSLGLIKDAILDSPLRWFRESEWKRRSVALVSYYAVLLLAVGSLVVYSVTAAKDYQREVAYTSLRVGLERRLAVVEAIDDVIKDSKRPFASSEERAGELAFRVADDQ